MQGEWRGVCGAPAGEANALSEAIGQIRVGFEAPFAHATCVLTGGLAQVLVAGLGRGVGLNARWLPKEAGRKPLSSTRPLEKSHLVYGKRVAHLETCHQVGHHKCWRLLKRWGNLAPQRALFDADLLAIWVSSGHDSPPMVRDINSQRVET